MALATQCPHCQTRFRVASDQLKLRGGIVRCGACQRIFDGSAHLIDLDAPTPAAGPAALPETPAPVAPTPAPLPPPPQSPEPAFEPVPEPAPPGQEDAGALPQDPEPPHGDVLAHAVEEAAAAEMEVEVAVNVDLPPLDDDLPEPEAAEPQPQDAEPPHGDVLAHAVEAAGAAVEADAVVPPAAIETAQPLTQDPEPPHGDVLAHAVESLTFAPPNRIDPRIEPWGEPRIEPLLAMEDSVAAVPFADPVAPETIETPAPPAAPPAPTPAAPPTFAPLSFAPPGRIEPSFDLPVDEELVAQPLPGDEPAFPVHAMPDSAPHDAAAPHDAPSADASAPPHALPLRASVGADPQEPTMGSTAAPAPRSARAKAAEARARRTRLTPTRIEAPRLRVPESDEPEFVKRSRKQEQSGRTRRILMAIGAVVLLLVLAAQLVLNFRNVLAARYPGARPALGAACALFGCRVELPTQIDNLAIENGELTTLGPDTYSLNTLLRNQGSLVQAWPSIELELTDANDKAVLRRVFTPAEYLQSLPHNGATGPAAASAAIASGFGARSEQPIKLHFALADLKPSSYHIFIFYP
jgi:predicted Zn finger-like uncharacterized protein